MQETASLRKNLRSRSRLTGDIREYCLNNTRMPPLSRDTVEEDDDLESEALNEMLQKITGDKNKLTELLVKNLMKNQDKPRNNGATRLDDCPVKGKFSSLEAWLDEVELWDETSKKSDK